MKRLAGDAAAGAGPPPRALCRPGGSSSPPSTQQPAAGGDPGGRGSLPPLRGLQLHGWRARAASRGQAALPPSAKASGEPGRLQGVLLPRATETGSFGFPVQSHPPARPGPPSAGGTKPGATRPQGRGEADPGVLPVHPRPAAPAPLPAALPRARGAAAAGGTMKGARVPPHPSPRAGSPCPPGLAPRAREPPGAG